MLERRENKKEDVTAGPAVARPASPIHQWRILVSGKVQGVFYRKYTARKAAELGVTGFVRNLEDGRVEIMAEGTQAQLSALQKWCYTGSPKAKVLAVDVEDCTASPRKKDGEGHAGVAPPAVRIRKDFLILH